MSNNADQPSCGRVGDVSDSSTSSSSDSELAEDGLSSSSETSEPDDGGELSSTSDSSELGEEDGSSTSSESSQRHDDLQADQSTASTSVAQVTTTAAFSVAQALSMVRQKRDEEQRAAKKKEEELEAQRLEKAREKRRRRRRNQRLRKAQLKSQEKTEPEVASQDQVDEASAGASNGQAKVDGNPAKGKQLKRKVSCEPGPADDCDDEVCGKSGDELLKKLPVKKRIKLETSESAKGQAKNGKSSDANPGRAEAPPKSGAPSTSTNGGGVDSDSKGPPVNRLIPRALLLKMSKKK